MLLVACKTNLPRRKNTVKNNVFCLYRRTIWEVGQYCTRAVSRHFAIINSKFVKTITYHIRKTIPYETPHSKRFLKYILALNTFHILFLQPKIILAKSIFTEHRTENIKTIYVYKKFSEITLVASKLGVIGIFINRPKINVFFFFYKMYDTTALL